MIAPIAASLLLTLTPFTARVNDVQLAAQHLRGDHPNLFHDLSPARFDAAVADLNARAGALDDDGLMVGLMRIAALPGVRDGHTGIFPPNPAQPPSPHAHPIRMFRFFDGTYVVGQAEGTSLLRTRVVAIDGHPLEDVMAAVAPLVPHDNESMLALRLPTYLNTPEVLHGPRSRPERRSRRPSPSSAMESGSTQSLTPLTVADYGRASATSRIHCFRK